MTTHEARPSLQKKSFASVAAAAAGPRGQPTAENEQTNAAAKSEPSRLKSPQEPPPSKMSILAQMENAVPTSMSRLNLGDTIVTSKSLNEHAKSSIKRAGLRVDDDNTLVSNSTNTNSFDGKSTASGTTFAFDEKESLRPDDSASVQAVDDDELGSGPLSGAQNSRYGSEAGAKAFQGQFSEVSANMPNGSNRILPAHPEVPLAAINDSGHQQGSIEATNPIVRTKPVPEPSVSRPLMPFGGDLHPDAKLFEALDTPKDRLFLLRLEKIIVDFINATAETKILLPPCNSFCRLLAHKLADYYGLTHWVDSAQNAVILFRTPYCRIRTSISELPRDSSQELVVSPTPPMPTMTIMRRPDLNKDGHVQTSAGGTTESSVVASKAGSEIGEENLQNTRATSPTGSTLVKETKANLTREEREARYKLKREQLFGPQNESNEIDDSANEISRGSSRSDKKGAKKKARSNNDDFEGRSEYFPAMTYPGHPYPHVQQAQGFMVQYGFECPLQVNSAMNGYNQGLQEQIFSPSVYNPMANQQYAPMDMQGQVQMGYGNHVGIASWDQQQLTRFAPIYQQPSMPPQQYPGLPSPTLDGNYWGPAGMQTPRNTYSNLYQPQDHGHQQNHETQTAFHTRHTAYPQSVMNPQGMSINPGTYMRQSPNFNPQTRSFVPAAAHNQGRPSIGPNASANNSDAIRQNANTTHLTQNQLHPSAPFVNGKEHPRGGLNRRPASHTNGASSSSTSSLAKWAAPATLPAKPPPPDAPPMMPEALPVNNQFSHKPPVMMGGQPMPQFHNGIYTMPGGRQHG